MRDRAKHVEDELAGSGRGVDLLLERDQPDTACFELIDGFQQFAQGPAEAIEAHDAERVAGAGIVEQRGRPSVQKTSNLWTKVKAACLPPRTHPQITSGNPSLSTNGTRLYGRFLPVREARMSPRRRMSSPQAGADLRDDGVPPVRRGRLAEGARPRRRASAPCALGDRPRFCHPRCAAFGRPLSCRQPPSRLVLEPGHGRAAVGRSSAGPYARLSVPPQPGEALGALRLAFDRVAGIAAASLPHNPFAKIQNGESRLHRPDALPLTPQVRQLRAVFASNLPQVPIEDMLRQVDQWTGLSRALTPLGGYEPRGADTYRTLLAAIIAHGTNLGIAGMSGSIEGITADQLQHASQ
jgi:hypothetical protein